MNKKLVSLDELTRYNEKIKDSIADKITYSSLGINNYDNSSTYSVGDYTRYLDKVYKCNTAIETAEDFDSSKWTQSTVLEYLKDALNIHNTGAN